MLVINRTGPIGSKPGESYYITHGGERLRVFI